MARQRYYPPHIQRVHHHAPQKRNTDLQLALADYLDDNWTDDTDFKQLAESFGDTSRETVRKVFYSYFGPTGDPLDRSFNEIINDVKSQLGQDLSDSDALEEYWKARGELPGQTELNLPDNPTEDEAEEPTVPEGVRDDIYQQAVQDTYQRAFEQGRQSVFEDLPDDVVLEYFGEQALKHKQASEN